MDAPLAPIKTISRFYKGHWLRLAISWRFWGKYGGKRIEAQIRKWKEEAFG
jgi:hypothetical protein